MTDTDDPFRHHPELAPLVTPFDESFFSDFTIEKAKAFGAERGLDTGWMLDDATRDACRQRTLAGRWGRDLWVFGYGSLIWDPGVRFAELRRASAPAHERRFILVDTNGGRGMPDTPGLIAALDAGAGCEGVVFRIPADRLEEESARLWARERIGPAYRPAFIETQTAMGPVEALTFVADHAAEMIHPDLPHEDQVRLCATGEGILGTSFDYAANVLRHFETLGIEDPHLARLVSEAKTIRDTL